MKEDDLKSSIITWCKEQAPMAPYAIPTVWKVVATMPRNAMGKVNKKELVNTVFPSVASP